MSARSIHHLLVAAALASVAVASQAGPLAPGGITPTSGLTGTPALAGVSEQDDAEPFAFVAGTGFVSGTVQHLVLRAADGSVDFYWRIRVDPGSTGRVDRLTVHGFRTDPTSLLVADYRADSLGTAPSDWAERSFGEGSTISFRLVNGVGSGEMSRSLLLDAKAFKYTKQGKLVLEGLGGGVSASQATFVPSR